MSKHLDQWYETILRILAEETVSTRRTLSANHVQVAMAERDMVCNIAIIREALAAAVQQQVSQEVNAGDDIYYYALVTPAQVESRRHSFQGVFERTEQFLDKNLPVSGATAAETEAKPEIGPVMAMLSTGCLPIGELALDEWWKMLDAEVKAYVFTTYMESFADDESEAA